MGMLASRPSSFSLRQSVLRDGHIRYDSSLSLSLSLSKLVRVFFEKRFIFSLIFERHIIRITRRVDKLSSIYMSC